MPTVNFRNGKINVSLDSGNTRFATPQDQKEANDRVPFNMDLSWVTVCVSNKKDLVVPALGLTFTIPDYNGFNFVQMRDRYKNREQYLGVLAHELVHAGTVYLDTSRRYVETKAYDVSKGGLMLGEYAVALNTNSNFAIGALKWLASSYIPMADKLFYFLPKVTSALRICFNTSTYREAKDNLTFALGNVSGNYVLGRLNGNEIEEFAYTNDVVASVRSKKDLKWRIMRSNLKDL